MARDSGGTSVTAAVSPALEILELVNDARATGTPLRISGRSHWMDAGRPVDAMRIASLARCSGIVDYVPGDLTITVRAGTTLREIEEAARPHRQWLPLDPFGSMDGTIGATIATGSFGPLATGFGRARDLVLGVEFVTGEGKAVRGGGRVVKNVAGFDLVRLITGSWGTLGIITEATLRLYSLPSHQVTLALGVPDAASALSQRISSILSIPGNPLAVELIDPVMGERLGIGHKRQALVRLGGNAAAVTAQRSAIDALGGAREVDPRTWQRLQVIEDSFEKAPMVARLSALPGRMAQLWREAGNVLAYTNGSVMHATPSLGIVRCILPHDTPVQIIERLRDSDAATTVIFERLPSAAWATLSPTVVGDRISQGLKKAFDPSGLLNPGILGPVS